MSSMIKMMGQIKEIQGKMEKIQESITAIEVDGVAGGGMVNVRLNGKNALIKLKIDDSLLCKDNSEILEDLIIAAHSDARKKIEGLVEEKTLEATAGLPIPSGFKFPF
ncbi:MAG: YbaB/EbfC family nucleoid-associated protein [Candidatus Liberibacter europaeus]|uniref:Nucleoid-associated protein C4617_01150 n=1 Tax=Candidatus Liberibacter europaeus TaxID=744859 RepID=A0A2T4VZ47_9HYPH|nr:YbaB/EbfC family nucleoid-associated protein [Candidatus Liberibacter europaeus]PTL87038.1 MAG: YbaB/EbfC family nucleoid-associated protein [Candidatus Liberibacter europaeus]